MSHWYTRTGEPMHTVPSKDGTPRPTTLREARKLDLLPSVTTIIKPVGGGKVLTDWIADQAVLSALAHPGGIPAAVMTCVRERDSLPVEKLSSNASIKEFLDWCREDSQKRVRDKAELGGAIHAALNSSFVDPDEVPAHFLAHVGGVRAALAKDFGEDRVWHPERNFACDEGFGGCIDLDSEEGETPILLDFKCKEFDDSKDAKRMVFDEHVMQLGGYRRARAKRMPKYQRARCINVFVSTSVPGLCKMHEHSVEDIDRGESMFLAALAFWRASNKYTP